MSWDNLVIIALSSQYFLVSSSVGYSCR